AAPQQSHASTNEKDSSNQAQDEDAHQAHHGAMQSMQYQVPAAHLDAVNAKAQQLGMQNYRILFPQSKTGVYTLAQDTISGDISDPRQERMLHLDQYSNEVLQDVTWQDYNLAAKLVATSVALHEGRITWLNKAFNTLLCIGLIILPITGLVIWWLRRPKHAGLASPKVPTKFQNVGIWKLGVVVLIGLSILFPLAGLSIFTVMLLDFLIISRSQKLSQWLK
ncbi:MAG: PepSY-associated TM helix domain-containing protein, partial [Vibrio sp.]